MTKQEIAKMLLDQVAYISIVTIRRLSRRNPGKWVVSVIKCVIEDEDYKKHEFPAPVLKELWPFLILVDEPTVSYLDGKVKTRYIYSIDSLFKKELREIADSPLDTNPIA